MAVSNLFITTSPRFEKQINGVLLSFNYTYSNGMPPGDVNVSAHYSIGGGITYSLDRIYLADGSFNTYDNTPAVPCEPFNEEFNEALKSFVLTIFQNFNNPATL